MISSQSPFTPEQLLAYARKHDLLTFTEACFQTVVPGGTFGSNWHLEAITHALRRVLAGEVKRLIIAMPPRSLKSICASVAFPAFVLGHDPSRKIVCVSYSDVLASKHANHFRAVMRSASYRGLFPGTRIDPSKDSQGEVATHGARLEAHHLGRGDANRARR